MSVKSFFGKFAATVVNVSEACVVYTAVKAVETAESTIRTAGVVRQTAVPTVKAVAAATELTYNQGRVVGLVVEERINRTTEIYQAQNEKLKELLNKGKKVQDVGFFEAFAANRK